MRELASDREARWVESTHDKESARALEMLHVQLISAVIDPYSWKWVILGAHHALQAFLRHESDTRGREETAAAAAGAEREIRWLRLDEVTAGEGAAPGVESLYDEMKRARNYVPPSEVDRDVRDLCAVRACLAERNPGSWRLHVVELPAAIRNALTVVEFLGWNPGHVAWGKAHLSDLARVKYQASQKVLASLERQYQHL